MKLNKCEIVPYLRGKNNPHDHRLSSENVKAIREMNRRFYFKYLEKRTANQEPRLQLKCRSEINWGEQAFLGDGT